MLDYRPALGNIYTIPLEYLGPLVQIELILTPFDPSKRLSREVQFDKTLILRLFIKGLTIPSPNYGYLMKFNTLLSKIVKVIIFFLVVYVEAFPHFGCQCDSIIIRVSSSY